MRVKNLIIYITPLVLVLFIQVHEARAADTMSQIKEALEQAQAIAKEKIHQWTKYFESEYAKWTGDGAISQEPPSAVAPTQPTQAPVSPVSMVAAPKVSPSAAVSTPNERSQFAQIIEHTRQQVAHKEPTKILKEGQRGTTVLPKSKSGVPVFALTSKKFSTDKSGKKKSISVSVSHIPRLDIGVEKSVVKSDFIPTKEKVNLKLHSKLKKLSTPEFFSQKEITFWKNKKLPVIAKAKPPQNNGFQLGQIVTQNKINEVSLETVQTKPLASLKPVVEITQDDLNMMVALIIYEKGNRCHLASGLFAELTDKRQYAEEANFYLGICAHEMGFHTEAVSRLLKVIESENLDFLKPAISSIVEDLPREHDSKVVSILKKIRNVEAIDNFAKDSMYYIFAREAHDSGQYKEAQIYSEKVSEQSAHYMAARYMHGIALYALKKLKEAEESLLKLREWMNKKNKSDKNIEALVAVNLARIRFMQGRHQSALEEYARVPKDHPLWVQGLIEQGWTQLNTDDPEGAVGNMYSLHSPYFKSIFMPESWVVRTIGYINICQYGDAYKTLSRLEQLHGDWLKSVNHFISSNQNPNFYYDTVKKYIKGRSDQNVDGLPYQVIREIARQRGFLNAQNALNVKEDEINQYNFVYGIIKKDQSDLAVKLQRTRQRLAKTKSDLKKVQSNSALIKNVNEWNASRRNDEMLVLAYQFQTELFEASRKGYLKLKASSLFRIDKEKSRLRVVAGQELVSHLKDIRGRIGQIFEGNEFLRYEIFSGSGENIRFQVSNGVTDEAKRIPANVKPQKMLNWEFDGEYWEDEIGSYRSSLKNNCPKSLRTPQALTGVKK